MRQMAGFQLICVVSLYSEGVEVGVVYFRTYYSPDHYTDEKDWQIRLLMERSKAIKCPSIHYQLAGKFDNLMLQLV